MQSTNSIQTNYRLEEDFEKLFEKWKEELSCEPHSLAIRIFDKANTSSARQFVQLSRKPPEREIFLRFAHNKIESGNHVFAGVVIKVLQLSSDSLLEEHEKDGISTEEVAERILTKIDLFLKTQVATLLP